MAGSDGMCQIDPCLISAEAGPPTAPITFNGNSEILAPTKDINGEFESLDDFGQRLKAVKKKALLHEECVRLQLPFPKTANLERLRRILIEHWFPRNSEDSAESANQNQPTVAATIAGSNQPPTPLLPAFTFTPPLLLNHAPASFNPSQTSSTNSISVAEEITLVHEFGKDCDIAGEILGYDQDVDEEDNDAQDKDVGEDIGELVEENRGEGSVISDSPQTFKEYQKRVRIEAAQRAEGDRRVGGLRTQKAMVRAWNEFVIAHKQTGQIKDDIVDEHSLLLYIQHVAERPKRTPRGVEIPGTYVGASQIKKQFFGALRIRKEQEAVEPSLTSTRPATSVGVWDAVKNRMNEALERTRNGLVGPNEDAPDIVANTFLAEITQEELDEVGKAFLCHRELRCAINGHLSWTVQHATGNRGDDIRALKLSELQPWQFLHPNQETTIFTVLGLQGEEKARRRGMRTTINPVYTSLIAHERPDKCPLGALAFFFHYIYDVKDMATKENIDWLLNKSWRQIRLLHSSTSYTTAYSAQCLYSLYVKAFARAGLNSRLKLHLARHILGYLQEALGVDGHETSKLGWKRGETYSDVYSPALPKTAILACHGYKEHETYDPLWRHVHVPEQFLRLSCPMAEEILSTVRGEENLRGTTGHWDMVVALRPFLFQCGAYIFDICPESPIFKLPALANTDVRNWMATTFKSDLAVLKANSNDPVNLQRLKDRTLQLALEELRVLQNQTSNNVKTLSTILLRRTAILSPAKNFSNVEYHQSAPPSHPWCDDNVLTSMPVTPTKTIEDDTGSYQASDKSYRAFVSDSPTSRSIHRQKTQVDLVLPSLKSFVDPDARNVQLMWPPILGQQGVSWSEIFKLVKQPKELWDEWKPSRSMDQYLTVEALWKVFNEGEAVYSEDGTKTGMKPPLNMVEKHFGSQWRTTSSARKIWSRMREIPDWIDKCSSEQGVSPSKIIEQLEEMRKGEGSGTLGLNALSKKVLQMRIDSKKNMQVTSESSSNITTSKSDPIHTKKQKRRAAPLDPRKKPRPAGK